VAHYLGLPLDMFQRLMIAPASISTLFMGEGFAQLVNLNLPPGLKLPEFGRPRSRKTRKKPSPHGDKK
jgi:hypothetical protein